MCCVTVLSELCLFVQICREQHVHCIANLIVCLSSGYSAYSFQCFPQVIKVPVHFTYTNSSAKTFSPHPVQGVCQNDVTRAYVYLSYGWGGGAGGLQDHVVAMRLCVDIFALS